MSEITSAPEQPAPNPNHRVVVIDDNANDLGLVRRFLEREGYHVEFANSGEAGISLLRTSPPDCVLVDFRMPGMDGYEVCRRIKNDPDLRSIAVLMLTGADSAQNVVDGLEAGADDFVTKSSDIQVILARVAALLRMKTYQDQIVDQSHQLQNLYDDVKQKNERITALNNRLESDLRFARRVQEALLPERQFFAPGVQIRATYIPSETLSGDFYDYFLSGDRLYLFMADVSGHGLAASILVSLLKSYLHSEAGDSRTLAAFMTSLNNFLFTATLPSQFATAQLFRFDRPASRLFFSNAAHPPFLLFRKSDGKAREYERPGHLLGAMTGLEFDEDSAEVGPGDILFTYTDGLTDRRSASGEFYSLDRIASIIEKSNGDALEALFERVHADVSSFTPTDDFKDDIAFILTRFE